MFVLVLLDQRRQQVKQMLLFRRNAVALLEQLFDLFNCVVVLLRYESQSEQIRPAILHIFVC
jgi:hypothetical protein